MKSLRQRLYLATIADNADTLASRYGLGLEIDEFCTAMNLDNQPEWQPAVDGHLAAAKNLIFHAPFNDLVPVSIDPLIRQVALKRYTQAYEAARRLGIRRMVYHTGYIPNTTHKEWFIGELAAFWRSFLRDKADDMVFHLENVLEDEPDMLCRIVDGIADHRVRLCLDIGHAHCVSPYSVEHWVETLGSRIGHVHLHDNDKSADRHLPLSEGSIALQAVFTRLEQVAPHATLTLENQDVQPSLAWIFAHEDESIGER